MLLTFDHLFIAPSDYSAALSYYEGVLGFSVDYSWGGDGQPRGVSLRQGPVKIVLAEKHHDKDDNSWVSGVDGTRPTVHIKCTDIHALESQLRAKGAQLVIPVQPTHWGVLWLVIADLDGNLLAFFQETDGAS